MPAGWDSSLLKVPCPTQFLPVLIDKEESTENKIFCLLLKKTSREKQKQESIEVTDCCQNKNTHVDDIKVNGTRAADQFCC